LAPVLHSTCLYHKYGHQPFLNHFRDMQKQGASEGAMLARYKELHSGLHDDTLLLSWFRDQVLHPHETQQEARPLYLQHRSTLGRSAANCVSSQR
jgi:hypothetical protein